LYFFLNNQTDALIIPILLLWNSTCFGHLLCPSSGVFCCTFGTGKFHAVFWWPLPSRVRMNNLTLLGSGHQKPAWNLPVPNVQYSWWWAKEMPETCRVL